MPCLRSRCLWWSPTGGATPPDPIELGWVGLDDHDVVTTCVHDGLSQRRVAASIVPTALQPIKPGTVSPAVRALVRSATAWLAVRRHRASLELVTSRFTVVREPRSVLPAAPPPKPLLGVGRFPWRARRTLRPIPQRRLSPLQSDAETSGGVSPHKAG
jgi:hypothetical protein